MSALWDKTTLGEALQLEYGKPLSPADRTDTGRYAAYGANGIKCWTDRYYFDKPSIIVGRKGSAGEVTLVDQPFWPLDVTYFVTFDSQRHSLKFLFWALKYLRLPNYATGVKPGINRNNVYAIPFAFPPLPEQERIVAILDEVLEAIDTAIANTEKNLANARELFESCLLDAIRSAGDISSLFTLKEISSDFGRGKSKHRPRNDTTLYGGEYPFVQTGDVRTADHVLHTFSQNYNENGLAQSKLWPKGTVCITIAANIAETAILGIDACFPDSVIGVVPNPDRASPDYVEYLLQGFSAELKAEGEGTAQDNINMGTFKDRKFPFPSLSDQLACVNQLNSVRSSVRQLQENLSSKLTNLQELKQSILQKAFSGELTVSA